MAFRRKDYSHWVLIGEGGEARVFRARQLSLPRMVAIREVKPEAEHRAMREAEILAQLRHQGLAVVIDYGYDKGKFHLVQDYVRGAPTFAMVPMHPLAAVRTARFLARTLAFLHSQGLVHGDLKPGNLLLTRPGECVLVDFGMVRHVGEAYAGALGSPRYAAPEQFLGKPWSVQSDVFSFGSLLYYLVSGRDLFEADSYEDVVAMILGLEKPERHVAMAQSWVDLAPELYPLLEGCLRFEPGSRFEDMEELEENLEICEQRLLQRLGAGESERVDSVLRQALRKAVVERERVALEAAFDSACLVRKWDLAFNFLQELLVLVPADQSVHVRLRDMSEIRWKGQGRKHWAMGLVMTVVIGTALALFFYGPKREKTMDQVGSELAVEVRKIEQLDLPGDAQFRALDSSRTRKMLHVSSRMVPIPDAERFDQVLLDQMPQPFENGVLRMSRGLHVFRGRIVGEDLWLTAKVTVADTGEAKWDWK